MIRKFYDAGADSGGGTSPEVKAVADEIKNFKAKQETAVEEVKTIATEAKAAVVTLDQAVKANQKVIDDVQIFMQDNAKKQAASQKEVSFKDALGEELEKRKDEIKGYTKNSRRPVNMELKAVGNMQSGNFTTTGTQGWLDPAQLGGVGRKPYEMTHLRNVPGMSSQAISGTSDVYVIRDAAGEGGPTAVGVGAAKPQSDRDYVKLIVPITKIAHYFKIPEEYLEDMGWLQSEISTIGVEELMAKEDDLFLNQVGGAGLFAGLTKTTNSTAYAAPSQLALLVYSPNNYDVLVAAWTQLRNLKNGATAALCNPGDYASMVLSKSSNTYAEYVFGAPNIAIPNVFGVPLIPHTAIAADTFLIGDFSKVRIAQRAGISVRFYDQNEDDAIKNMVTVVIEERVAIVADRSDRLVYGSSFATAKTALLHP